MKALTDLFQEWMPHQRWFGGKGREWAEVTEDGFFLDRGNPVLSVHRVRVTYADGARETYLVPLSWRDHPAEELESAFVGAVANDGHETYAYDAMRDRDATTPWLIHLVNASTIGPMHFHPAGVAYIPEGLPGDIVSGEQSNTSLIYGQEAILKLFRRLEPGLNPDVEIHDALRRTENKHIAPLLGHIEIDDPDGGSPPATVAMLQTFVPNASDGWRLATASVRDLYAEGDLHADEVGGDFAAESHRLGAATAEVHRRLAELLDTRTWTPEDLQNLVTAMHARLDAAVQAVPQLEEHAPGLREAFDALGKVDHNVQVQRVHGDLHLGQTLRTVKGWKLIDFEGEPAKSLPERVALDSPLRDVAAMLRSFDYAAANLLTDHPHDPQIAYRCREWAQRNRVAFCEGYSEESPVDPRREQVLMRAYETDKAIYEVVYEARNRPTWLRIPMAAIARLSGVEPEVPAGELPDERG
jgi:maltokinase